MPQKTKSAKKTASRQGNLSPLMFLLPIALLLLVLAYLWQYVWRPQSEVTQESPQNAVLDMGPNSAVRINEIMSSNKRALMDDFGKYSDWIELQNTSRDSIDISGWTLTDDMQKRLLFSFPDGTVLGPGEFVVVFASNQVRAIQGYPFHAPFKLSATGDAVMLFNAAGLIMESVNVPLLSGDQVYMRDPVTGEWMIGGQYTPGLSNTDESFRQYMNAGDAMADSPLLINEVMADNATYIPDEDGDINDWIEIYNNSDAPVNLEGYGLSDDEAKPMKWMFPAVTLGPRSYLIVYASGKDRKPADGQDLHTSFSLGAEGEPVTLASPRGQIIDHIRYENLKPDISYSRQESGGYTTQLAPSPGQPNTRDGAAAVDDQFYAQNPVKLYINEVMASARQAEATSTTEDWLELYNASASRIDLEGYGISDNPGHPRKWQFPSGAYIEAGSYMKVALSSLNKADTSQQQFHANFSLALTGDEGLVLAMPDGLVIDRVPLVNQRAAVAYGRVQGKSGFFFLSAATAGKQNTVDTYEDWVKGVTFETPGGLYSAGSTITVELKAPEGAQIRYTTDCREPNDSSTLYTGPFQVSATAIIRARAFESGCMPSFVTTQTYFVGVEHTMQVISLVSTPENLTSDERGIMAKGPNAYKDFPYGSSGKGANFWMDWERAANIEIYNENGTVLSSQGMGIKMQGAYSRAQRQKAFIVTARNVYGGGNVFKGRFFPNRPFTEYKSLILRASGQDGTRTRLKDSILTSLAEGTGVMYQDTNLAIVYINGEYAGHYNMRERIHKYSIAQHMGWTDVDKIDIVKANTTVLQGSDETFAQMLSWLKQNGATTSENLARIGEVVDIDNYLTYVAFEMYLGNTDTLNVKRYRSTEGDGKWRWVLFDLDWAMNVDTNSFVRWLDPSGMGNGKRTNNTLFVELMKNTDIREKFLHLLGDLMATNLDKDLLLNRIEERQALLLPEMPAQQERYGYTMDAWYENLREFKKYTNERPKKLLGYIKAATNMSTDEMRVYFGEVMDKLGLK